MKVEDFEEECLDCEGYGYEDLCGNCENYDSYKLALIHEYNHRWITYGEVCRMARIQRIQEIINSGEVVIVEEHDDLKQGEKILIYGND